MFLGSVCYGSDFSGLWCQACFVIVDNVVYEAGFEKSFALKKGKNRALSFTVLEAIMACEMQFRISSHSKVDPSIVLVKFIKQHMLIHSVKQLTANTQI